MEEDEGDAKARGGAVRLDHAEPILFPLARIKKLMTLDSDVHHISRDAVVVTAKATVRLSRPPMAPAAMRALMLLLTLYARACVGAVSAVVYGPRVQGRDGAEAQDGAARRPAPRDARL